jgi:hypothetical protein
LTRQRVVAPGATTDERDTLESYLIAKWGTA